MSWGIAATIAAVLAWCAYCDNGAPMALLGYLAAAGTVWAALTTGAQDWPGKIRR